MGNVLIQWGAINGQYVVVFLQSLIPEQNIERKCKMQRRDFTRGLRSLNKNTQNTQLCKVKYLYIF